LAEANCCIGSGRLLAIAAHVALVAKVIGIEAADGVVSKGEGMRVSSRRAGGAMRLA
jgi:hypothetical protein